MQYEKNKNEAWISLYLIENLSKEYKLNSINSQNKFEIILSDYENKKICITLPGRVHAYRRSNKIENIFELVDVNKKNTIFFKVENSSYMEWLSSESSKIINFLELNQYSIVLCDYIVDIVAFREPKIEFID